ncbi:hypothetical protein OH77DRAFT_1417838 [Trametes cingulata]|nr:hypothetical protein OH77DRAFT_1417838 [Trametes cingulata]
MNRANQPNTNFATADAQGFTDQGQQGDDQLDYARTTGQDTGRRPQGAHADLFAPHVQLASDSTAAQGGDFNADPTSAAPRAAAGRDDNFGTSAPGNTGSTGTSGQPGMGEKFVGNVEKAAGRVTGKSNMVERGEVRKTGGPQADDTLL